MSTNAPVETTPVIPTSPNSKKYLPPTEVYPIDLNTSTITAPLNSTFESHFKRMQHISYILSVDSHDDQLYFHVTDYLKMSAMYWSLMGLYLTGGVNLAKKEELLSFLEECYDETTGGYRGNIDHSVHLLYTLSALQILAIFEKLDSVNPEKIVNFVSTLQRPDGSFVGDCWGETDTRFSYCAMLSLALLNKIPPIDAIKSQVPDGDQTFVENGIVVKWDEKFPILKKINFFLAIKYVLSCRNFDGGFGAVAGGESHSGQIFCSLAFLSLVGMIDYHRQVGGGSDDDDDETKNDEKNKPSQNDENIGLKTFDPNGIKFKDIITNNRDTFSNFFYYLHLDNQKNFEKFEQNNPETTPNLSLAGKYPHLYQYTLQMCNNRIQDDQNIDQKSPQIYSPEIFSQFGPFPDQKNEANVAPKQPQRSGNIQTGKNLAQLQDPPTPLDLLRKLAPNCLPEHYRNASSRDNSAKFGAEYLYLSDNKIDTTTDKKNDNNICTQIQQEVFPHSSLRSKSKDPLSGSLGWWLCDRQLPNGGLNGRPEKKEDVCYSWWVLTGLKMLNKTHWVNKSKLTNFIMNCQDPLYGGISDRSNTMTDVYHTFFGIAGLSLLGNPGLERIDPVYALPVKVLADVVGMNKKE